jgi:hypothetical protein
LYNNVSISRDYGFRAERSDKLAIATLGGGQISLDSGDGAGNYTPAVYFDVVTHKYKFIGDIVMEGGSISWDTVEKPNVSWDSVTDKPDIGDVALGRINSTYMDANGIWTPKVYATNISALLGKITVAQIEQLEVGTNVTMGPNASISWSQVSSRPYIPSTAADVGAIPSTYIDAYGVFTPMVYASNLYGTAISGKTLENVSGYTKSLIDSSGVHLTNKNSGGTAQIEKLLLTTTWDYDNEGTIVFTNNNSQQAVIDFDTSRLGIITSGLPLLLNGSRVLTTADSMTAKFA